MKRTNLGFPPLTCDLLDSKKEDCIPIIDNNNGSINRHLPVLIIGENAKSASTKIASHSYIPPTKA